MSCLVTVMEDAQTVLVTDFMQKSKPGPSTVAGESPNMDVEANKSTLKLELLDNINACHNNIFDTVDYL